MTTSPSKAAQHAANTKHIASVVGAYWLVSISMVYLNKVLMTNTDLSIPAPIFVTWFQCLFTTGLCYLCGELGEVQRRKGKTTGYFNQFPAMRYNWTVARKIAVLSLVFVGMVTFNNLCLKYVEVSFYNVARSLTIVFNVFLSFAILRMTVSGPTLACLVWVFLGFWVGADGEANFSLVGTLSGVCSSLFVSLNSIYTKKVLPVVNDNQWVLTFVNNMNACLLFIPLILFLELPTLLEHWSKFFSPLFWAGMSLSGLLGFAIGTVTVMQIKATSPLTHNISGTAKAAFQSILAFYLWGNPATTKSLVGIALVLGGSSCYTYVAMKDAERKRRASGVSGVGREGGAGGGVAGTGPLLPVKSPADAGGVMGVGVKLMGA
eukprot:evm.model.NODE_22084_length_5815_cov_32.438694.2